MIASQMRVQSIPAVFGFVGGQPVDGFMGAQTPTQIQALIDKLVAQSPAGDGGLGEALEAAEKMLEEGAVTDAADVEAGRARGPRWGIAIDPRNLSNEVIGTVNASVDNFLITKGGNRDRRILQVCLASLGGHDHLFELR